VVAEGTQSWPGWTLHDHTHKMSVLTANSEATDGSTLLSTFYDRLSVICPRLLYVSHLLIV